MFCSNGENMSNYSLIQVANSLKFFKSEPSLVDGSIEIDNKIFLEARINKYLDECIYIFESLGNSVDMLSIPQDYIDMIKVATDDYIKYLLEKNANNTFFKLSVFDNYNENISYPIEYDRFEIAKHISKIYKTFFDIRVTSFYIKNQLEIESYKVEFSNLIANIETKLSEVNEEVLTKAKQVLSKTEAIVENVEEQRKAVSNLVSSVTMDSNVSAFHAHAEKLNIKAKYWLGTSLFLLMGFVVLFGVAVVKLSENLSSMNLYITIIERSVYLLVTFLVVTYCAKQYSKERNLSEQYRFKSIALFSANLIKEIPHKEEAKDYVDLLILSQVLTTVKVDDTSNKDEDTKDNTLNDITKLVEVLTKAGKPS
jgi:hypothetical protein